jgi:hypothetical protein
VISIDPPPKPKVNVQESISNAKVYCKQNPESFVSLRDVCGTIAAAMTPDIVANAIVVALSAGAVAGAKDTAKSAIADAYQGLKSLVKKKFGHESDAAQAIEEVEAKPDSEGRKKTLAEELNAVNSSSDPELVDAAQSLIALIKALPEGEKHIQVADGIGIAQADRGSSATVTMNAPLREDD